MTEHGGRAVDGVLDLSASLNPFAPDVTAIVERAARRSVVSPDTTEATAAMATALGQWAGWAVADDADTGRLLTAIDEMAR